MGVEVDPPGGVRHRAQHRPGVGRTSLRRRPGGRSGDCTPRSRTRAVLLKQHAAQGFWVHSARSSECGPKFVIPTWVPGCFERKPADTSILDRNAGAKNRAGNRSSVTLAGPLAGRIGRQRTTIVCSSRGTSSPMMGAPGISPAISSPPEVCASASRSASSSPTADKSTCGATHSRFRRVPPLR